MMKSVVLRYSYLTGALLGLATMQVFGSAGCAPEAASPGSPQGDGGSPQGDGGGQGGTGGGVAPEPASGALTSDRTLLLVAGVLTWPDPRLPPFNAVNRRDKALHEHFVNERGVPEARTKLLLDEAATKA